MRILYVINSFEAGGAEHGLLTLAREGFFSDHEFKVIGFCTGRHSLANDLRQTIGHSNVITASPSPTLTLGACASGARMIAQELRDWRPDAMILSLKQANIVGRFVAKFFPAVRCISFEHISRYRARRLEWLYPLLLYSLSGRVDEVWADCRQTLDETRHYFKPRPRTEYAVPLFRCDPAITAKTDYKLHKPIRVAGAGRLIKRKNFAAAIEAAGQLRRQGIDITLDILGDGEARPGLEQLIAQHDLATAVSMPGYRKNWHTEMRDYDLFINLSETEGFCIVVAEAMSVGLPIVATDVGGIREYGVDGANMIKLAKPSVELLTDAMIRLIEDEALRAKIGRQAHADIVAAYSPAAMRARAAEIFSCAREEPA